MWRSGYSGPQVPQLRAVRGERGIYFTILAGIFFVILAVIGLAVDAGMAYRSQLFLQSALDMAALRGTSHVLESVLLDPEVLSRSRRLTVLNLRLASFSPAQIADPATQINVSIIPLPAREGVRATGRIPSPSMIMRLVPGMPSLLVVGGNAAARSRTVSLMLVLDRSGSMAWGIGGPYANRMAAVIAKAQDAVSGLQPGDQIGLVHYGTNVTAYGQGVPGSYFQYGLSPAINAANSTPIKNELNAAIGALSPTDTTNTWEALSVGRSRMLEGLTHHLTVSDPARARAILFLTDGVPCCTHNWQGEATWDTDPHNNTLDRIPYSSYSECEKDPGARELNLARAERMISSSASPIGRSRDVAQMVMSNHTINEAILAQRAGITVHAIGIGGRDQHIDPGPGYPSLVPPIPAYPRPTPPAPWRNLGRNPYQQYRDMGPVKELFLAYVANDQLRMQNPPLNWLPSPPPPPSERPYFWDFPCTVVNTGLPTEQIVTGAMRANDPRGIYAFAENATELGNLFEEIIRASRIRFVE